MACAVANYRLPTTPREAMCGSHERHSSKPALVSVVQMTLKEGVEVYEYDTWSVCLCSLHQMSVFNYGLVPRVKEACA